MKVDWIWIRNSHIRVLGKTDVCSWISIWFCMAKSKLHVPASSPPAPISRYKANSFQTWTFCDFLRTVTGCENDIVFFAVRRWCRWPGVRNLQLTINHTGPNQTVLTNVINRVVSWFGRRQPFFSIVEILKTRLGRSEGWPLSQQMSVQPDCCHLLLCSCMQRGRGPHIKPTTCSFHEYAPMQPSATPWACKPRTTAPDTQNSTDK